MTLHRTLAAGTAALAGALVLVVAPAPAGAHGATTDPVSRAAACGPDGAARQTSAACRAAVAANGGRALPAWDNLRVPAVAGRDRDVIPDGRLCSAGLAEYRGLDLPRRDWPSTRLTAGASHTFAYRSTITHKGTFRLYVTRDGYDPTRPLRWSDLESEPFLTAVDPQLRNGSYHFWGRLPANRTGRHVIYTVWQNSDTPDTYYSCSDVDLRRSATAVESPGGDGAAASGTGGAAETAVRRNGTEPPDARAAVVPDLTSTSAPAQDGHGPLVVAGIAAGLAVVTAVAGLRRARRGRQEP